ncbi:hypothetical protein ACFLXT_02725 [Chloroflexota bacterium]
MGSKLLRQIGISLAMVVLVVVLLATPVCAIALPDDTPAVVQFDAYRNVLETGDFLILIYENTPYASTPSSDYSENFIWRMYDTAGTTEYAQALGFNYNASGYGYNVVSFYFDSGNVTALMGAGYWDQPYVIKLSGTPFGFADPPIYTYAMSSSDYSDITVTAEVKTAIGLRLVIIANDLYNKWGLVTTTSLLYSGETGTVLSTFGEAFFRGAIYGVQAMAPGIFSLAISNVNTEARTWITTYQTLLESQYSGNYIDNAFTQGEEFLDVSYNLMGLLLVLFIGFGLIFGNWYVGGRGGWHGLVEAVPALVIGGRLAMLGMGELGLIATIAWLFISAKVWRVI